MDTAGEEGEEVVATVVTVVVGEEAEAAADPEDGVVGHKKAKQTETRPRRSRDEAETKANLRPWRLAMC